MLCMHYLLMILVATSVKCRPWIPVGRPFARFHSLLGSSSWNGLRGVNSSAIFPNRAYSIANSQTNDSISADNKITVDESAEAVIPTSQHSKAVQDMLEKYKGKMICVSVPRFPHCDIFLCGTLHVADYSTAMVKEAIQTLCPNYVMLELCEGRVDSLIEDNSHSDVYLKDILKIAWQERSVKTLAMGLLSWMQSKAAKLTGSKLGGELSAACKEAYLCGSTIILGDRLYTVTIQRIFDKLRWHEKVKMLCILFWESLTMSVNMLSDYLKKSQHDELFINEEIEKFTKYLPSFSQVVIFERDEYLAQTLSEIAKMGFKNFPRKGSMVAVVGAGHLRGIEKQLLLGDVSAERLEEISSSSRQGSTWPDRGQLQVVDTRVLYKQPPSI